MAFYVSVVLSFHAHNSDSLVLAASETLASVPQDSVTRAMLTAFIAEPERFIHIGTKGAMFVSAGVWNKYSLTREYDLTGYELPQGAINEISAFLLAALERHAILPQNRALLLVNPEENDRTYAYEFSIRPSYPLYAPDLVRTVLVRRQVLQLGWDRIGDADFPGSESDAEAVGVTTYPPTPDVNSN